MRRPTSRFCCFANWHCWVRSRSSADLSKLPPLEAAEPEGAYLAWTVVLHGAVERAKVEEVFEFVNGDCTLSIEPLAGEPPAIQALPVLPVSAADPVPEPVLSEAVLEDVQPISQPQPESAPDPSTSEASAKKEAPAAAGEKAKQTIRVDLDKVDRLVNLVGELVITQAMLSQRVIESDLTRTTAVGDGLNELEHLLRDLQEGVMAIRTQPVKSVFQRMPRLVRELSAQVGKQVHLVVEGEATEVDKTVIERLGEPLTHMIRNAIDHGLETAEDRIKAGKSAEGQVKLSWPSIAAGASSSR